MRLYRVTYRGTIAAITSAQLQAYYDGLVAMGLSAVGQPVVRTGTNGLLAGAWFNDAIFTMGMWNGNLFIEAILWRDTIDHGALENLTRNTFPVTSFHGYEDDMGTF